MSTRPDGRHPAVSWTVGILCAGVIGALVWFSLPMVPLLLDFAGSGIRQVLP